MYARLPAAILATAAPEYTAASPMLHAQAHSEREASLPHQVMHYLGTEHFVHATFVSCGSTSVFALKVAKTRGKEMDDRPQVESTPGRRG